jgi:plastocyanin
MHLMRWSTAVLLIACPAIMAPTAVIASTGTAAETHTVVLEDRRFRPSTLTIDRGESVTWVWRDGSTPHNVTAPGFASRTQTHGSFTVRFNRAGTFNYRCTIHEGMVGKVVVR